MRPDAPGSFGDELQRAAAAEEEEEGGATRGDAQGHQASAAKPGVPQRVGAIFWEKFWEGVWDHPFVSVFRFSPFDPYTRPRRVTVLFCATMNFLFFNAMFLAPCDASGDCSGYSFWQDFVVGMLVGVGVGIPERLFSFLFRRTRTARSHPFSDMLDVATGRTPRSQSRVDARLAERHMRSLKCLPCASCSRANAWFFPHWVVFVWYTLALVETMGACAGVVLYGLYFNANNMRSWLIGSGTSSAQDNFAQEPILILLGAAVPIVLSWVVPCVHV